MISFHLNRIAARWLQVEAPVSAQTEPPDWDGWLLRRMARGEVVQVHGVLVDRAVLRQRFACVPDRCAPATGRGRHKSCCADAFVPLSAAEDRRLASRSDLLGWMRVREPRLARCEGRGFHREGGEQGLARPGGRCVFSELARGRIRCLLHPYAKHARIDRGRLQPVSCRLFPLIVVDRGGGRTLLTVVASHTRRLVAGYPAGRYPCLSDASLPPLYQTMRSDLDWLYGKGFARALGEVA